MNAVPEKKIRKQMKERKPRPDFVAEYPIGMLFTCQANGGSFTLTLVEHVQPGVLKLQTGLLVKYVKYWGGTWREARLVESSSKWLLAPPHNGIRALFVPHKQREAEPVHELGLEPPLFLNTN